MFGNLGNILSGLSGSLTTSSYAAGAGLAGGASPASAFKRIFGNLLSTLSPQRGGGGIPNPSFAGGLFPQVGPTPFMGPNNNANNAYKNIQSQFISAPGSFLQGAAPPVTKALKKQVFQPGAVVINPASFSGTQPQISAYNSQFTGTPFQGFAGQNGTYGYPNQVQQNGQNGYYPQSQFGLFPSGPQGGFSALQFILGPVVGLFSMIGSIFSMRKLFSGLKPVEVDKTKTSYGNTLSEYDTTISEAEGSFDPYFPENEPNESLSLNGELDLDKLQEF